jgi:hypothetical protein
MVSVDVGDVRERLAGVTRCIITEPNAEALGRALTEILRGDERSNGRDHLQSLTLKTVATQLREFYLQVLVDRRSAVIDANRQVSLSGSPKKLV